MHCDFHLLGNTRSISSRSRHEKTQWGSSSPFPSNAVVIVGGENQSLLGIPLKIQKNGVVWDYSPPNDYDLYSSWFTTKLDFFYRWNQSKSIAKVIQTSLLWCVLFQPAPLIQQKIEDPSCGQAGMGYPGMGGPCMGNPGLATYKGGRFFSSALTRKGVVTFLTPQRTSVTYCTFTLSRFFLNTILNSSKGCQVFALGSPPFGSAPPLVHANPASTSTKNQGNKARLHILDTQMDVQKKSFDLLKTWKLFQQIAMLEAIGNVFADPGSRKHLVGKTFFGR